MPIISIEIMKTTDEEKCKKQQKKKKQRQKEARGAEAIVKGWELTVLSFVLWRKITSTYNDIARKYGNVTVKYFRDHEKVEYKRNKLKLDIDFLNNCKQIGVYLKFLIFKLPNVSNKDALSFRKSLLRNAINKRNKELLFMYTAFCYWLLYTYKFYNVV